MTSFLSFLRHERMGSLLLSNTVLLKFTDCSLQDLSLQQLSSASSFTTTPTEEIPKFALLPPSRVVRGPLWAGLAPGPSLFSDAPCENPVALSLSFSYQAQHSDSPHYTEYSDIIPPRKPVFGILHANNEECLQKQPLKECGPHRHIA